MTSQLRHRGPDDEGFFESPQVGLGMRRLAVIDPDGSRQPVRNETETVWAICNGEIYNFRDLQRNLRAKGHRLRSRGDAETIVHLYEDHGLGFVHHLRGMFAIALWDSQSERLVLARDRLGIKPLHFSENDRRLLFASELTALYTCLEGLPQLDLIALAQHLAFGYIPAPRTIFTNVHKLPAGHILIAEKGRVSVRQYWDLPIDENTDISFEDAADRLHDLLLETVSSHLVSDVPLGALLSGGVDSSVVVSAMARVSATPVETFSVGFDQPEYDELRFARQVASHLGTNHHELFARSGIVQTLPEVVRHHGEPFADPSSLPTLAVSELARRHVTVALSGDGGDELFGGYTRYQVDRRRRWVDWLPVSVRRRLLRPLIDQMSAGAYGVNFLRDLLTDRTNRYLSNISSRLDPSEGGLAAAKLFNAVDWTDVAAPFLDVFERVRVRDFTTQLMYVDLKTYLADGILTKVDRMSMARSLEVRVPLLDHLVVEFAVSLPVSFKIQGARTKRVLVAAMKRYLPAATAQRRKQGFGLPLAPWFKANLSDRLDDILGYQGRFSPYLSDDSLRRLMMEHQSGRRDQAVALWKVLVLVEWEGWMRQRSEKVAGKPTATTPV